MATRLANAIFHMWDDVDRAFAGLTEEQALEQHGGGSAFAWTLVHIANFEDGQFNFRLRGKERNAVIQDQFTRFRDTPGAADNWQQIQDTVQELRAELRTYLEGLSEQELEATMAPATARTGEQPLTFLLWRDIAHTYYHIGEVAAKRDQLGQRTGDYPAAWDNAV